MNTPFFMRRTVAAVSLVLLSICSLSVISTTACAASSVTTASNWMGTYRDPQSVTLTCSDPGGTCTATYYCLGAACTPTTVYSAPISITASTTLKFYSKDASGRGEAVKSYDYIIDSTVPYRFERNIPQPAQPSSLPQPQHVALDADGNLYVTDSTASSVRKFDSSGVFITQWGGYGSGNGQFYLPYGIVVDSGYVYVTDTYNNRIQKFDKNGTYIAQWGGSGSTTRLNFPRGVALDSSGNLYVADQSHHCIKKFNSSGGDLLPQIGVCGSVGGSADGQLDNPYDVAVDANGNVYVADNKNNRIQKFDSGGVFQAKWTGVPNPYSVALDSSGNMYVADTNNSRIQKLDNSGNITQLIGSGKGNGQLNAPGGVRVDTSGNVYVADTYNHRIQKFDNSGVYLFQLGATGSNSGQFRGPSGVAVGASGAVYVADTYNYRVQKFNSSGEYQVQWDMIWSPYGMAVDSSGNVYVADTTRDRIQKFDSSGVLLTSLGVSGTGNGQFDLPYGVAVDASGNIYVADTYNNRIQKFDSSGVFQVSWGTYGSGNGQFNRPWAVAVDLAGNNVFVADTYNYRVQKFDKNGIYIAQWGGSGSGNGQFTWHKGIAVDTLGNVFVADSANNRIQKFDNNGTYLTQWGVDGSGNGQFFSPESVAVDAAGTVYVADSANHRIQKFVLPVATPGAPTGVTAVSGYNQAVVSFIAPLSSGGGIITGYTVTASPGGATASGSASPIVVSGLSGGTAYTFSVVASNAAGNGPASLASTAVTPYTCAPQPAGLVSWWRGEGSASDWLGGHNGTLNGMSFVAGRVGQGFSFNGTSDYVSQSGSYNGSIANTFTMEFWAMPTATRASTSQLNSGSSGNTGQRYAILPESGGSDTQIVGAGVSVGTNGISVFENVNGARYSPLVYQFPTVKSGSEWVHVAVVYANKVPSLYVNGALVSGTVPSSIRTTIFPSINFSGSPGYYKGALDEVRIYNVALSQSDIQKLYSSNSAGVCVPPTVSSITPSSGFSGGGTAVTITGSEFTGPATVSFSGTAAASSVNSASQISAVSPPGVVGLIADITVTTPAGTSAISSADQFTYLLDPNSTAKNMSTNAVSSLATALSAALTGVEIRALGAQLDGAYILGNGIILKGGWDSVFLLQGSTPSTLNGGLTVQGGDSTVETLVVKGMVAVQGGSLRVKDVTVLP